MTNEEYINQIGAFAVADYLVSKLLPSTVIAQAIHETGWGKSPLAVKANNHFGIKASAPWTGAVYNTNTGEETPAGATVFIAADFRQYPSLEASVKDHGVFLTTGWRKDHYKVYGVTDAETVLLNLKAGGYATDSSYVTKVMKYITTYDLTSWDKKALTPSVTEVVPEEVSTDETQGIGWIVKKGTFSPKEKTSVFNAPSSTVGVAIETCAVGQTIEFDSYFYDGQYEWLHCVNISTFSGEACYVKRQASTYVAGTFSI